MSNASTKTSNTRSATTKRTTSTKDAGPRCDEPNEKTGLPANDVALVAAAFLKIRDANAARATSLFRYIEREVASLDAESAQAGMFTLEMHDFIHERIDRVKDGAGGVRALAVSVLHADAGPREAFVELADAIRDIADDVMLFLNEKREA